MLLIIVLQINVAANTFHWKLLSSVPLKALCTMGYPEEQGQCF